MQSSRRGFLGAMLAGSAGILGAGIARAAQHLPADENLVPYGGDAKPEIVSNASATYKFDLPDAHQSRVAFKSLTNMGCQGYYKPRWDSQFCGDSLYMWETTESERTNIAIKNADLWYKTHGFKMGDT